MRYIQSVLEWLWQTIGPWLSQILKDYPYVPLLLIGLLFLIIALVLHRNNKPRKRNRNKAKVKTGYQNFKGEAWHPNGQSWNSKTKRWEAPDYKKENTTGRQPEE